MTKSITMVTNNVFRCIRLSREGSSNMYLFSFQQGTLRSNMINHTAMVACRNKLRSVQIPKMKPKQRFCLKSISLHFMIPFMWRYVH